MSMGQFGHEIIFRPRTFCGVLHPGQKTLPKNIERLIFFRGGGSGAGGVWIQMLPTVMGFPPVDGTTMYPRRLPPSRGSLPLWVTTVIIRFSLVDLLTRFYNKKLKFCKYQISRPVQGGIKNGDLFYLRIVDIIICPQSSLRDTLSRKAGEGKRESLLCWDKDSFGFLNSKGYFIVFYVSGNSYATFSSAGNNFFCHGVFQ